MSGPAGGALEARWFPIVLAGPSGSGKTTVGRALERLRDVRFSVSATTRPRRTEEVDGRDYLFLDRERFEALIEDGEMLEWAEVYGELYGTPLSNLEEARADGRHLLLDIDVQGARSVREAIPGAVTVFLLPPDARRIVRRLVERGSEGPDELRRRLRAAEEELRAAGEFDYVVVNDELEDAVGTVEAILRSEARRIDRLGESVEEWVAEFADGLRAEVERELGGDA